MTTNADCLSEGLTWKYIALPRISEAQSDAKTARLSMTSGATADRPNGLQRHAFCGGWHLKAFARV
jgi:hypothetical protein